MAGCLIVGEWETRQAGVGATFRRGKPCDSGYRIFIVAASTPTWRVSYFNSLFDEHWDLHSAGWGSLFLGGACSLFLGCLTCLI